MTKKLIVNYEFYSESFCPEWQQPFGYFAMHKNISTI